MPIDPIELRSRGVHSGNYRKIFSGPSHKYPEAVKRLVDLASARNRDGISLCLKEYKAYAAIDAAYSVSFNQTTPTLVRNIMSRNLDKAGTIEALKDWGLSESELFLEVKGANGTRELVPNAPVFFAFLIPLVKAYVQVVLGQIYNERNTSPLLVYKPLKQTNRNRVLCGMLTDIIETISTNYGYAAVLRSAIHQALKYGVMIAFPREEWDCESQIIGGKKVTIREGIRYNIPHPTRMAYDLKHPLTTLNSDTGCEWALNWDVLSYGDILDNRDYWNKKSMFAGTNWFLYPGARRYFEEVFPCRMSHPCTSWDQPLDRLQKSSYYTTGNRDQAVFVSHTFMKIIPSAFGLGLYNEAGKMVKSYDYPVWHRFIMASDDTVCWANPCAYNPTWFMGYDYDENSDATPSLALDLIPFQDHLGNIISQMILSAKQNLMNCTFYDSNMVNKTDIERLINSGEKMYRSVNFVEFDSLMRARGQVNQANAFIPVKFEKQNIVELLQLIPVVLNILERVLGIAAQEAGSSATHQQSKEEVIRTGGASKNRRTLTAASIDEGTDAWMRQLYYGFDAYGDPKIAAQVDAEIEDVESHLRELGFEIIGRGEDKILATGHKNVLVKLEGFARRHNGPESPQEKEVAQVMMQTIGTIAGQDDLRRALGPKNLLKLIEQAAILAGAPSDFRLPVNPNANGEPNITPEMSQALQALSAQILKTVEEKMIVPAAQHAQQTDQELAALNETVKRLQPIFDIAQKFTESNEVKARETQQKMQMREAEFQAEEKRKQEAHALKLQQEAEAARVQAEIDRKKAENEMHLEEQKTRHNISVKAGEAAAKVHIAKKVAEKTVKAKK